MTPHFMGRLAAAAALAGIASFAVPALAQTPPAPTPPMPPAPTQPTVPAQPTMPPSMAPAPNTSCMTPGTNTVPRSTTPNTTQPVNGTTTPSNGAPCADGTNPNTMPRTNMNQMSTPTRNMLTNNPNGSTWLAKFDRPNIIAKNRRANMHSAVGRGRPPR